MDPIQSFISNPPVKAIANYCLGLGALCLFAGVLAGILTIGVRGVVRFSHPGQIRTEEQMTEKMSGDSDTYEMAKDITFGGAAAGSLLLIVGSVVRIATRNENPA